MKKIVFLFNLLIVSFFLSNHALAGRTYNPYYHRIYSNEIIEDLWTGKVPSQDLIFAFLDVVSDCVEIQELKDSSLDEILEYYRPQFHLAYKHEREDKFEINNEVLSANVDYFIDFARRLLIFNTYSNATITNALNRISQGNYLFGD